MNDTEQTSCLAPLQYINVAGIRACRRSSSGAGCISVPITSDGQPYTHVCGKVIGYQKGTPDAFSPFIDSSTDKNLDDNYLDGFSLTHGQPGSREHIWTFAAALYEIGSSTSVCPCSSSDNWPHTLPPFIQDNWFCDSGNHGSSTSSGTVYADDPLWDGQGCGAGSTCCTWHNPPWFCATLSQPTDDDLELRLCRTSKRSNEDVYIKSLFIYVSNN